jgi:sugar phosphate isomerase/epimerase
MSKKEISMNTIFIPLIALAFLLSSSASAKDIFARDNLVAWCIVPFDSQKRTPAQRAEMLEKLGIHRFAYDWRAEHLPTFETELNELQLHHIELTALWFPAELNADARLLLDGIKKHDLHPQLWVMMQVDAKGDPNKTIASTAATLRPIAVEAAKLKCQVALYNHGGWFGEPENQIAIIETLKKDGITNVGMVYNLHHGHEHLAHFPELLAKMKPYLLALNLNGMTKDGDKSNKKILPLGQGDLDLQLLKIIRDSGYSGLIGILNHTDEDAEGRLMDNLDGLDWLAAQLNGKNPGPAPRPRTYHP